MTDRPAFTVQHKRRAPNADYASKPGDARRSGRAAPGALAGAPVISIEYRETGASIEARLGVVVVGAVTHDPTAGYFWAVYLPDVPRTPRPAASAVKARSALDHKIREWCAAARLMSARRS
ncbi:hypothetical protein [Rhodopseudomonas sp. BR0G17]|uniref:hypothetical protein n=1 Tax=Rhodopseudomonas sp. BR0G17 TaxID=2269368 RepID=UPI0013E0C065|nr:hypothetical protein [Rhodopseudomonas sp. BR0G17]